MAQVLPLFLTGSPRGLEVRKTVLVSALCSVLAVMPTYALAQATEWTATIGETGATVADCANCDEQISVLVTCDRGQSERQVHFMFLEQRADNLAGKKASLTASADGETIKLSGKYSKPGQAGPYPIVILSSDHPLMELLSHAKSVKFTLGKEIRTLSMAGSRTAFNRMNAVC